MGIESFGDRVGDERRPLFLEQLDQSALFGNNGVDAGGFTVKEIGDMVLLFKF